MAFRREQPLQRSDFPGGIGSSGRRDKDDEQESKRSRLNPFAKRQEDESEESGGGVLGGIRSRLPGLGGGGGGSGSGSSGGLLGGITSRLPGIGGGGSDKEDDAPSRRPGPGSPSPSSRPGSPPSSSGLPGGLGSGSR